SRTIVSTEKDLCGYFCGSVHSNGLEWVKSNLHSRIDNINRLSPLKSVRAQTGSASRVCKTFYELIHFGVRNKRLELGIGAGRPYEQRQTETKQMAQVQIYEGESIESALRRFKRKVLQEDIIKEVKKHSFYLKPGEKKRIKQAMARKRARKKIRRQPLTED